MLEHKWLILITCECTSWITTIAAIYVLARHKKQKLWFITLTIIAAITGWVPHLVLSIFETLEKGKITFFLGFVIVLVVCALIFGKKLLKHIERFFKNHYLKGRT